MHPDVVVRPLSEPDARRTGGECSAAWDGQRAGRWTFLTAWLQDRLVASGFLRWEGPFLPDIAARLPGQVEVAFLQVQPDLRGHGIGTGLLELAERLAGERGVRSLGLGVGDDNAGARRLYERLGTEPTVLGGLVVASGDPEGLRVAATQRLHAGGGRHLAAVRSGGSQSSRVPPVRLERTLRGF